MTLLEDPQPVLLEFACDQPECTFSTDTKAKIGLHRWNVHKIKAVKEKKPPKDKAPTSVNVNLGTPTTTTKDKELAAVEARAVQLMQTAAALLLLTGHNDDAGDVAKGADAWGKSVRELAVYEEWLRKLASGGEIAGRTMAWINLALITLSIAVPILHRHGALPDNLAEIAVGMFGVAETLQAEPEAA